MDNYINQVLNNRYEIQEIIGVGGMAIVYKAYDRVDDRIVAVKMLKDEYLANEEIRTRFKNESQAIAVLSHPNIVKVYDVCFGEDLQYIVMEHVEGITLKEYIKRQKVLDWKEAVHFVVQILRALQHAHDKGIIHRDIKPQNILLLQNASIKVTDFGIARFNRGEIDSVEDSSAIGSVHYVSPEQARGEYTDEKSDIYSVGVVLYEMLTGKVPFESETDESVAMMQLSSEAVRPTEINPSIPAGLEQITLRAMQKNAGDRYQSAAEFLSDLDEFKKNPSIRFDYAYFIDKTPTKFIDTPVASKLPRPEKIEEEDEDDYDDDDDDEGTKNNTIPVLVGIAIAMVVIVAAILLIAFGGTIKDFFTGGNDTKPGVVEEEDGFFDRLFKKNKIEAPNFINKKYEDVLAEYKDLAIENPPKYEYNTNYEDGYVCKQSPAPGEKVSKDTVFKLTVASSNQMVLIRDVTGYTTEEAQQMLKAAGLEVEFIPRQDDTKPEGEVLYTDPSANTYIEYKGTVYVYYAASAENADKIMVPQVIGYELEAAKAKIAAAGLNVGAVTQGPSSPALKGYVISQSPNGLTQVTSSVNVNLVIGNGVPSTNTAVFKITLPALPEGMKGTLKTYLNEKPYDSIADVPLNGASYQLSFTGKGEKNTFKIYIDSVLIYTGEIDFTKSPPEFSNGRAYQFSTKESVPDVTGLTEEAARQLLNEKGFVRIRVTRELSDTVEAGYVISQTPVYSASAKYPTATQVTIVISKGTGEAPAPEETTEENTSAEAEPEVSVSSPESGETPVN